MFIHTKSLNQWDCPAIQQNSKRLLVWKAKCLYNCNMSRMIKNTRCSPGPECLNNLTNVTEYSIYGQNCTPCTREPWKPSLKSLQKKHHHKPHWHGYALIQNCVFTQRWGLQTTLTQTGIIPGWVRRTMHTVSRDMSFYQHLKYVRHVASQDRIPFCSRLKCLKMTENNSK